MSPSVLITGTSKGGIGDHIAQEFLHRGFEVFATARDTRKIEHLQQLGTTTVEMDVTSPDSIQAAVQKIRAASGGRLDVLVNNAGAGKYPPYPRNALWLAP